MKCAFVTGGSGFVGRNLIKALVDKGVEVRALARSDSSVQAVELAGAAAIRGDLQDEVAMRKGMEGCDTVFHSAAFVKSWGNPDDFYDTNVMGTAMVLAAAKKSGVSTVVFIGTEAVLVGGGPIRNADETRPLPEHPIGQYPLTKGLSERTVLAANNTNFRTVSVRPRFVWGRDDTSVLTQFVDAVKSGRFVWLDGGAYNTSTCHVANLCEGAILAAEKGEGGQAYFLTDGEPVEFRWFVTQMLATQDITPSKRSVSFKLAYTLASIVELFWKLFRIYKQPPLNRSELLLMGEEVTVNDNKARRELGYVGQISVEQGLQEMRESNHKG